MKKLSMRVEGTHGVCNGYPKALPGRERTQKKTSPSSIRSHPIYKIN